MFLEVLKHVLTDSRHKLSLGAFFAVFSVTKLGCSNASETSFHALTAPKIDGPSGALIGSMLVGFPKYLGGGKAAAGWFNSCWHCSFSAIIIV